MISYGESRERLFGLVIECPLGAAEENCPLRAARGIKLRDQMEFSMSRISDPVVSDILTHHEACVRRRLLPC